MTCKINLIVIIKIIDLNISHINSCNHIVGMDKIFSSEKGETSLGWIFLDVIVLVFEVSQVFFQYNSNPFEKYSKREMKN